MHAILMVAFLLVLAVGLSFRQRSGGSRLRFILAGSDIGALNFAAADAVLKEDYKGPVVEQLNNTSVLLAIVETNTEDLVGRRGVMSLHVGRNSGVGNRAENATLPSAGNQQYEDIFIPIRSSYARIQLTGQIIAAMSKSRGSFIRALEPEMEGATTDAGRDVARQIWGTSDGKICGVQTVNSTTITPGSGSGTALREDQLFHLDEDFLIDIGTTADPDSIASGRSVTSVNETTGAFTISGAAVNVTAGTHFVSRAGAGGTSANTGLINDGQVELTGIQTMVDDTAVLHTLDPATEARWKANVFSNSGTNRAISENLVTRAIMKTSTKSGTGVDLLISSGGVFRAYGELLSSMKRTLDEVDLPGGYSGLNHSAVGQGKNKKGMKTTLCWDYDAPTNRMFGLTTSDFQFFVLEDWDWIPGTVSEVLSQVGDVDSYTGTLKKYQEFACKRRNSQFVIEDLTEA